LRGIALVTSLKVICSQKIGSFHLRTQRRNV
jgi:hypothetical protein